LTLSLKSPSPDNRSAKLWDEGNGDGEDLVGTFPTTLVPAENLGAFDGANFNGEWYLTVADGIASFAGTLNSWGITIRDKITAESLASPITLTGLIDHYAYLCTVSAISGLGMGPASNAVSIIYPQATFSVGGSVSGLAGSGLVLQNNAGDDLPIAADGSFTFATVLNDVSTYAVTLLTQPTNPSQTCDVTHGNGTLAGADVTNVSVACVTDTFTVGGSVSGLAGSGLILQNNAGDDLPIAADGSFTFGTALDDASTYAVTVLTQPTNLSQTCDVTSGDGTLAGADVTNVPVTCVTKPEEVFVDGFEDDL